MDYPAACTNDSCPCVSKAYITILGNITATRWSVAHLGEEESFFCVCFVCVFVCLFVRLLFFFFFFGGGLLVKPAYRTSRMLLLFELQPINKLVIDPNYFSYEIKHNIYHIPWSVPYCAFPEVNSDVPMQIIVDIPPKKV